MCIWYIYSLQFLYIFRSKTNTVSIIYPQKILPIFIANVWYPICVCVSMFKLALVRYPRKVTITCALILSWNSYKSYLQFNIYIKAFLSVYINIAISKFLYQYWILCQLIYFIFKKSVSHDKIKLFLHNINYKSLNQFLFWIS